MEKQVFTRKERVKGVAAQALFWVIYLPVAVRCVFLIFA